MGRQKILEQTAAGMPWMKLTLITSLHVHSFHWLALSPKYFNFIIFSRDLLPIFMLWFSLCLLLRQFSFWWPKKLACFAHKFVNLWMFFFWTTSTNFTANE